MKFILQPFNGQIGNEIINFLNLDDFNNFIFLVAFAKNSGVLRLKDNFNAFRKRGGKIHAYVGIDLGGTSYEALTCLLHVTDNLGVVHFENSQTFHPKIYYFSGPTKNALIVGSSNLTSGGLWINCESSIIIYDLSHADQNLIQDQIAKLNELAEGCHLISTQADIDELLNAGYIEKEVILRINSKKGDSNQQVKKLFLQGIKALLPSLPHEIGKSANVTERLKSHNHSLEDMDSRDWVMWIETGAMTGGSRNILDLSMKSLIEKGNPQDTPFASNDLRYMLGAVEFFGIKPDSLDQTKLITLNFEGIDYFENTILLPKGESSNGTWRLQIKGRDSSGNKFTSQLREKYGAAYLTQKILTFTKISGMGDYFVLEVFPKEEIDRFLSTSLLIGRNGVSPTSRRMGIL